MIRHASRGRWRRDDGMVTAETALAMPALIVVLAGLVTIIVAVTAQLRCVAAAREGARAAARGEPQARVIALATGAAPDAASVQASGSGDTVTVTVSAPVRVFGVRLGSITVSGSATAQREPEGVADLSPDLPAAGALALLSLGSGKRRRRTAPTREPPSHATARARPGRAQPDSERPDGPRPDGERGSGTIYAAAAIGVLAVIVSAGALIGRAHVAHARAESAADLAALAAAQTLLDATGDPCARAAQIAAENSASVTECLIEGETVVVTASVSVRLGPFGTSTARGRARAGPVPDDGVEPIPGEDASR